MRIEDDERFQRAADALRDVWYAHDAGEHADESAKLSNRLRAQLAEDYRIPNGKVLAMVRCRAMEDYD